MDGHIQISELLFGLTDEGGQRAQFLLVGGDLVFYFVGDDLGDSSVEALDVFDSLEVRVGEEYV